MGVGSVSFMNGRRVVVVAIGSRGDVVPMVNLARRIASTGTETEVIGLSDYSFLAVGNGIRFRSIGCSMETMRDGVIGRRGRAALRGSMAQFRLLRHWLKRIGDDLARTLVEVVQENDFVLSGVLTHECVAALRRYLRCRTATVVLTGLVPSSSPESCVYALPEMAPAWLRRARARVSWNLVTGVSRQAGKLLMQGGKKTDGAERPDEWHKVLVAASPTLVPPAPDWTSDVVQTGYPLECSRGVEPNDDRLITLLEGEKPCVYVGFGSAGETSDILADRLEKDVLRAAERADVNVIVPVRRATSSGWASPHVLRVGEIDHMWLFPRVDGIVHHGGAGTTMTGLLSGTPSTVVSFAFDQAYHGRRLAELGVGPAPVAVEKFDASALETRLLSMTQTPESGRFNAQAQDVARVVAREDGVPRTLHALLGDTSV